MSPIVPAPPGFAVAIEKPETQRFAPASPAANYLIGLFDRGDVAQINSPTGLTNFMGRAVNYSPAHHDAMAQLSEGSRTTTIARVTGPAAVAATVTLNDDETTPAPSITVTATSVGEWGNNLDVAVIDGDEGRVKLIVTEDDKVVAATPALGTVADLAAWQDPDNVVKVSIAGANLPAISPAAALITGTDDRANIGTAQWAAALAKLDRRFGPGVLRAGGVDDEDVHLAMIAHANANNRVAFLDLADDVTENEAIAAAAALQSATPDIVWRAALWAQWAHACTIIGQPDRLIPWSAVQAGIQSRVLRNLGVGRPAFGIRRGASKIARRLAHEWTTGHEPPGEVQRLYADHINVAVDRGATIHAEGYRTLDQDYRREDLHVAFTLMWLAWRGEELALSYIGEPIDRQTLADYHADITGLCQLLVAARAINPGTGDPGFLVDVESVNNEDTMAARELHAVTYIRPTGSTHWTDITVGTVAANEQLPTAA